MVNSHRALLVTLAVCVLSSCASHDTEPKQLPPGNQAVCNAAHAKNARTVYNVRNQPKDTKLKTQAHRIYPGSSDTNDHHALNAINARCKDLGHRAP